jgi:arginine deiminase
MGFQACINKDINKVEVYLQKPNSSVTPFQLKIKTPLDDVLTAEREQKSLDAVRVVPVGDPSPWGHVAESMDWFKGQS